MTEQTWSQPITKTGPNKVAVRGYRIDELMGRISFGEMVYLILRGELPTPEIGVLMDAMQGEPVPVVPLPLAQNDAVLAAAGYAVAGEGMARYSLIRRMLWGGVSRGRQPVPRPFPILTPFWPRLCVTTG